MKNRKEHKLLCANPCIGVDDEGLQAELCIQADPTFVDRHWVYRTNSVFASLIQKNLEPNPEHIMKSSVQFVRKWYAVLLAFVCLFYSVGLGLMGHTDEALYSAHWAGTILLFSIAIRQRRTTQA